ncbi:MAG: helix-turn-helix domain-containing protein, partial [Promethearchaeota archaeon]
KKKKKIQFNLESIGYYHNPSLLTKRQKEVLIIAIKKGFFDIPRKISLSELAKELKISSSSLSETIRRINKKLSIKYLRSII